MAETNKQIEVYPWPTFASETYDKEPVVMTAERVVRAYVERLCESSAVDPDSQLGPVVYERLANTALRMEREVSQ